MASNYSPAMDAGWGLIYRLNFLWAKADTLSLGTEFDKWELVLDTIYRNLCYREELEIEFEDEEQTKIKKVSLSHVDKSVWNKIKNTIAIIKTKKITAMKQKDFNKISLYSSLHYKQIALYDIFLRKLMHGMGLYMKEADSNPSMSLFGNNFKKRK